MLKNIYNDFFWEIKGDLCDGEGMFIYFYNAYISTCGTLNRNLGISLNNNIKTCRKESSTQTITLSITN